jgi:uncharacterized membrane protein HdeD (DUF308 family)
MRVPAPRLRLTIRQAGSSDDHAPPRRCAQKLSAALIWINRHGIGTCLKMAVAAEPAGSASRRQLHRVNLFPADERLTGFSHRRTVMTRASDTLTHPSDTAPLRAKAGWIIALGVVYLIAGFIAFGSVVTATVASVLVVGVMMLVAGVAEVFNAFQVKSWGKFLLWALLGVLYIIAGFVTFQNPLLAAVLLTLILGASLVASGIMRIFLAFSMKREMPWVWVALSGVITLLLGLIILARWPVSSL